MSAQIWNGSAWKKVHRKTMWTGSAWKDIKSSHRWTGSAWETIYSSFMSSGMTKSGTQATTNSWTQIIGWTPDSGSTVSGNGLVADGSKTDATISAAVQFQVSLTRTLTVRLKIGATIIGTGTPVTGSDNALTTATVSVTRSIAAGEVVVAEVISANSTGNPSVLAGSGTFVRIA